MQMALTILLQQLTPIVIILQTDYIFLLLPQWVYNMIICIFLLSLNQKLFAQHKTEISVGASFSTDLAYQNRLSYNNEPIFAHLGYTTGINFLFQFNNFIGLQTGLLYSDKVGIVITPIKNNYNFYNAYDKWESIYDYY